MSAPGPTVSAETHDAVSERAAVFFARRGYGDWTAADQAELEAWLTTSSLNQVAYLRIQGIAARAGRLATVRAQERGQAEPAHATKTIYRRLMFPLLAAASVALIAGLGIPFVISLMQPSDRSYATDVGGRATIKFADGTEFELNTDTALRYRMTTRDRIVWLEKGEAYFHVTHDANHPFTVYVGNERLTDLGTEFLIERTANAVEFALVKGRAQLVTDGSHPQVAMLSPGDVATATRSSLTFARRTPQELADELSWRRGVLVFHDARLADAVQEVNRYNATKLVIADPSIADLKFTGEISNDGYESFLRVAEAMMKLRVERQGKNILLSRNHRKKGKELRI